MKTKQCFGCNRTMPLDQFYAHPGMKDGRLNKCIDCKRKDSDERFRKKMTEPDWAEKERKRNRTRNRGTHKSEKNKHQHIQKYRMDFPEKYKASTACQRIKCKDGFHKHHWSYNKEHFLDFIEIESKQHMKAHRFLVYDGERKMFRRFDNNVLLDTKQKHILFITEMISTQED